jgi:hypothetical protein
MPENPDAADLSDMELLRAEVVRLQDEVGKLRAKAFVLSGGPAPDDSTKGTTALQQRRMGRIVVLEHENGVLRHRLFVEEARSRCLMVDSARRAGDEVFRQAAEGGAESSDAGMMNISSADLMLLVCAIPPATETVEVEHLLNDGVALEAPRSRDPVC